MAPLLHVLADALAGADQGAEVGAVGHVDGRRHGDDDDVGLRQNGGVGRVFGMHGGGHLLVAELARRINAPQAAVDLALHNIETDGAPLLAEFGDERQTDITEANHGNSSHNNTFNLKGGNRYSAMTPSGAALP